MLENQEAGGDDYSGIGLTRNYRVDRRSYRRSRANQCHRGEIEIVGADCRDACRDRQLCEGW